MVIFERAVNGRFFCGAGLPGGKRGRRCRQDFPLSRKPMLIGLVMYAATRGPDLVSALANEVFQVLMHCERSRLSDVWSALDLSVPLTKGKSVRR